MLGGQCALARCQPLFKDVRGPEFCIVSPAIAGRHREFNLLFAPDTLVSRLAAIISVFPLMTVDNRAAALKQLEAMTEAPVFMLDDDPMLRRDYAVIVNGLTAIAEGRATDVSLN
jgi:hypothetical protein